MPTMLLNAFGKHGWQGIYLWEHRRSAHTRKVALHVIGE